MRTGSLKVLNSLESNWAASSVKHDSPVVSVIASMTKLLVHTNAYVKGGVEIFYLQRKFRVNIIISIKVPEYHPINTLHG